MNGYSPGKIKLADIARSGGDSLVGQVLNNCNNSLIQQQNNPDDPKRFLVSSALMVILK